MDLRVLIGLVVLLLLFSGCTEKNNENNNPAGNGPAIDDSANAGDSTQGDSANDGSPVMGDVPVVPPVDEPGANDPLVDDDSGAPALGRNPALAVPLSCNDPLIVSEIVASLGSGYSVTKGPPDFTKMASNCYIKKDNVSIMTFTVSRQVDSSQALDVLEDEKKQIVSQLFNSDVGDYSLGLRAYLIEQPYASGPLYKLLFVDGSDSEVFVSLKTNVNGTPKSTIESVARAIEKTI